MMLPWHSSGGMGECKTFLSQRGLGSWWMGAARSVGSGFCFLLVVIEDVGKEFNGIIVVEMSKVFEKISKIFGRQELLWEFGRGSWFCEAAMGADEQGFDHLGLRSL